MKYLSIKASIILCFLMFSLSNTFAFDVYESELGTMKEYLEVCLKEKQNNFYDRVLII